MFERVLQVVDGFSPVAGDPLVSRRARLVTALSGSMFVWVVAFSGLAGVVGAWWTAITIAALGWPILAVPFVMRRFGTTAGGNLTAATVFVLAFATAVLNGGVAIQMHYGMVVVPILAASTAGARSGVLWGGAVVAANLGLFAAFAADYPFPMDVPGAYFLPFQLMLGIAVPVVLICFVAFYELTREAMTVELQTREQDLAGIIDTAQDGLLVISSGGRLERVNPAAERLLDAPADRLVGSSISHLFPDGLPLVGGTAITDGRTRRADGTEFPADVTLGRLATSEGERFVAIVRDVTARHEAERAIAEARDRAVQASRAKSTFLANMSHELRTPLNAILGYAELIAEETSEGDASSAPADAARIISSGRHLMALINDVLDLSKIEAGKLVLDNQPFDVDGLIEGVASQFEPMLANRGNRLIRDIDTPLGSMVGDPLRLKQVLLNLLSNATKFTERGLVTLRARRCVEEPGRDVLMFEVADTGIGMAPDQLGRIFEDFVQADASTTRKYGGTGLGLAISRRIVHMMGGKIGVWSQPGVGSTFTFQVPVQPGGLSPATPVPLGVRGGVLVVDEDPWTRGALTRALRRAGMVVSMAATPEEAHDLAMRLQPKVMVLDVLRSSQKGWTLLERLRADPATASIPVAVLTMTTDRGLALALGATRLLEEPFHGDHVVDVVRELMPITAGHALVIEDDDDLREILVRTLTRSGWTVAEARDGADGLSQLAMRDPDVIVLDLMMPNMDGFEFVKRLQAHPTCRDVPVLVVTARDLDDAELDRLRGTVERVIHKGGQTRDQLLNEVLGIVRRQHTPQREMA